MGLPACLGLRTKDKTPALYPPRPPAPSTQFTFQPAWALPGRSRVRTGYAASKDPPLTNLPPSPTFFFLFLPGHPCSMSLTTSTSGYRDRLMNGCVATGVPLIMRYPRATGIAVGT